MTEEQKIMSKELEKLKRNFTTKHHDIIEYGSQQFVSKNIGKLGTKSVLDVHINDITIPPANAASTKGRKA
jgi:hypothetical protein